jgi:hypothetical protein
MRPAFIRIGFHQTGNAGNPKNINFRGWERIMKKQHPLFFLFTVMIAIGLAACGPSASTVSSVAIAPSDTAAAVQETAAVPAPTDKAAASIQPTLRLTETLTATQTVMPTVSRSVDCLKAQFIGDVTIPDGWEITPDTPFTKTWRLKNTGSCSWNPEFSLVFHSGDRMEAPESQPLTAKTVPPGETVDISVDLVSPDEAGFHEASFMIRTPDGVIFGIGKNADVAFWVKITVKTQKPPTAGAPVTKSVSAKATVAAGHWASASAACPAGWVVTGGGFSADSPDVYIYSQLPEGNGWSASGKNYGSADHSLTVYAICLSSPTAASTVVSKTVPLAAGGKRTDTVVCPAGSAPTGGGFSGSAETRLEFFTSARDSQGWTASARNAGSGNADYTVAGLCLSAAGTAAREYIFYMDLEPGQTAYGTSTCPDGKFLAGGGWLGKEGVTVFSAEWFGGWWRVRAHNDKSSTERKQLKVQAVCLGAG